MYAVSFLVVLVALVIVKDQKFKPFCVAAGILCTMVCSIYAGNLTVFQCLEKLILIIGSVLAGNYSLFITLLLFGVLIKIITESGALEDVSIRLNRAVKNKIQFSALLLICALAASVDDYLACMLLVMVLATCYKQFGLTKAELGFFVNTVVVAFCSMVPISTWAPVIAESLTSVNDVTAGNFYFRYCFNYFTYFSLLAVFVILLFKKSERLPQDKKISITKSSKSGVSTLLVAVIILYSSYFISSNSGIGILSDNVLLVSCTSTLIFCHVAFRRSDKIKRDDVNKIYVEGVKDMLSLVKFLMVLWVYTECLEKMLHINETILQQVTEMNLPIQLLPVAVYVFSGVISYCTGSVFATVRLLVPVSVSLGIGLGVGPAYLWVIAAAAISGSLLASVSPLSDTMAICSEKLKIDSNMLYRSHFPYSIMLIISTSLSYVIVGACMDMMPIAVAALLPVLIIFPIIMTYILALPYSVCVFRDGERKLYYISGLVRPDNIMKIIQKYVKHSRWYLKQIFHADYMSSKPKRTQSLYRHKTC